MLNKIKTSYLSLLNYFNSDARHYQMTFQFTFLMTGVFSLQWNITPLQILAVFCTALTTQFLLIKFTKLPMKALKSGGISALSLCLMFRADSIQIMVLAAVLAILSKAIFKVNGKHFYNPANFGLCTTMLLTHQGWISPGQWGSAGTWWFLIGILGFLVTTKAKRIDIALAFIGTFAFLHGWRILIYQQWPVDFFTHQFTNGALLLFTFFMITDPASTPSHKIARVVWAGSVGALAFYLQAYLWINGAPLWALFFLSPLTPLIDYIFKAEQFSWKATAQNKIFQTT